MLFRSKDGCQANLAGASPLGKIESLRSDSIIVSGWMDDIRDAYWSSKVFVAPLRLGSGLQNKLLEAMATLTPSITSSLANNALQAKENEDILIANSAQEFASQIIALLEDQENADRIAQNAYNYVISTFNWETSTQLLDKVIIDQLKVK